MQIRPDVDVSWKRRGAGDIDAALEYAGQLSSIAPNDPDLARLTDDLCTRLKQ
jgi:hypothetical protein